LRSLGAKGAALPGGAESPRGGAIALPSLPQEAGSAQRAASCRHPRAPTCSNHPHFGNGDRQTVRCTTACERPWELSGRL